MIYPELAARCAPLDARTTRYRFDLEADVAWRAIDAPGLHLGPALLRLLGLDPALADDGLFQWGAALALCQAFHDLERLILRFAEDEAAALGATRSLGLLVEEEEKHLVLFERYAARLRMARPSLAERLEADLAATEGLLGDFQADDPASRHYLFWLNTLFFEELTVLLDDALREDGAAIQPCWASLHAAHRREEVQHVVTDVAHLEALDLDEARRAALSKRFLFRLEKGFDRFFGLEAVARVAPAVQLGRDLRATPLFARLLAGPAFRRTREAAPYVAALAGGRVAATARVEGPALVVPPPADLPAALRHAAATNPDAGVTWVSDDGEREEHEPYPALLARATRLGAGLRRRGARPGDRLLLLLPAPRDLVGVLWGALLEGLVPAPVGLGGDDERLAGIHARLKDPLVVAGADVALPAGWRRVTPEQLDADDETATTPGVAPATTHAPRAGDPVFVQFSSGSTGAPRGVVLTHGNVLADLQGAIERQGVTRDDVFVSWMPLHHDMGLGLHLTPLLACAPQVLLPTALFARRPARWLRALSDHRATIGAAANFALALVTRRLAGEPPDVDLAPLRCLLVGAEPISADVLERFAALLAPRGLRRAALCPAYGLAEATVAVSFGHAFEGRAWSRTPARRSRRRTGPPRSRATTPTPRPSSSSARRCRAAPCGSSPRRRRAESPRRRRAESPRRRRAESPRRRRAESPSPGPSSARGSRARSSSRGRPSPPATSTTRRPRPR